jgi:glycerol-3-phosphate acyltransferase PlsY
MSSLAPWVCFLLAFLIGSIPFGLIIARIFSVNDLRAQGSGNIGATNVSRVLGFWPAGALTLFLDLSKGALCVGLALMPGVQRAYMGWLSAMDSNWSGFEPKLSVIWAIGACAVLGHCYSPWLKFKGGKGVATGLGVVAVLSPISALAGLVAFGLTFWETRIGSLSSITGVLILSLAYVVLNPPGAQLWFGAIIVGTILLRHESNLESLLNGKERQF